MPAPPLLLLLMAVEVGGRSTCPSPAEVAARLRALLPAEAPAGAHRVLVERDGREVALELRDADGAPLASRRLAADAGCADLAAAAAVVIATWEVELRGRGTLGLWLEPPAVVAEPPPAPPGPAVALSAGIFGDRTAASTTPALLLEAAVGRQRGRWEALLGLLGVASHRLPLADGAATWRRAALVAGGRVTLGAGRWRLGLQAAALGSLLMLAGDEFPRNRTDSAFDPGLSAGLRLGVETASVLPWVGVTIVGWPVSRRLEVSGLDASDGLPRWEALLGAGLAFPVGR